MVSDESFPQTDQSKNIGFCFWEAARENPDFPAIISEHTYITYWQLWKLVESFALKMESRGVVRGSVIAVNTTDMVVSLSTLLATALLGAEYAVASKLLAESRTLQPTHMFRSEEVAGSAVVRFEKIDQSWLPIQDPVDLSPHERFQGYADGDDRWLYLHTSGSTGVPKYLNLSQRIVFDRTQAIRSDFPKKKIVMATVFPYTSRPFFARAIGALLNTCTLIDSYDLKIWTKLGVNLVCGSPSQLSKVFSKVTLEQKINLLEVSGDKLTEMDAKIFGRSFENITDIYGASETNKTFANTVTLDKNGTMVSTGKPLDTQIEIVDDRGVPCEKGVAGNIRVKNNYMIPGYVHTAGNHDKAFQDGWFYPGDIGKWGALGELQILGRQDEIINLGGVKINALLVDTLICSVDGVLDAACFKSPKKNGPPELLAFAVLDPDHSRETVISDAMDLCEAKLGVVLAPRHIRIIDEIPKNNAGRPLRQECQRILAERIGLSMS